MRIRTHVRPTRTAPHALWLIAQTFLNTLFALFGPPEVITFQHTHSSQQHALMLPWLRAGEALMRRLLLTEVVQRVQLVLTRPKITLAQQQTRNTAAKSGR
jgi:hypothetical protein